MLMFGFSSVLLSQHQEKPYYRFGENLNFTSSFGYTIYSTEDLNDYHIRYFDNQVTMSLNKYFSAGLHYNYIFIAMLIKKNTHFSEPALSSDITISQKTISGFYMLMPCWITAILSLK
jgi:hypothetical protein